MVGSGILKRSNAGSPAENPMLWFSANQMWEPTATKILIGRAGKITRMTQNEQHAVFGCIRFGLPIDDLRLMKWKDACTAAGTPREKRRALEKSGRKQNADPAHWFAASVDVAILGLRFQVLLDTWRDADPREMVEVWADREAWVA